MNYLFDDYTWCPIYPFSEDVIESRDVVDDAFTGTLFQSRIVDGNKECMYVSAREWGLASSMYVSAREWGLASSMWVSA